MTPRRLSPDKPDEPHSPALAHEPGETLVPVLAALAARAQESGPPSSGLRGRIVASTAREGRFGKFADRVARLFDLSMDEARALLARAEDPASFGPGPVPGAGWLVVTPGPRYAGALAVIGRLEPGSGVPDHVHGGGEMTLVLEGGLIDTESGEEVWRGDELFMPEGSAHALRVIGGVPCVSAVIVPGGVTFMERTKV